MNIPYPRGSEWRKWDLHVHTPLSIEQYYGKEDEEVWEKYLKDLEALTEVKVLGINDYLFVDGYERLVHEKNKNGRLRNIDLLLPVVEFRISKFAGVDFGGLKRINLHVIFSNELDVSVIKSQFLNALHQDYKLEAGNEGATWSGVITKESLQTLGASIKATIPKDKISQYGSDLEEGFRNINLDETELFKKLENNSFLKDKYFTAVGKTEWDSLKWSDSSISTKKDIINKVDLVFVASESPEKYYAAKAKLKAQSVNDLLLDCSDAHYFSNSTEKDRIGNCYTWIKSDPTFKGLKQVLNEPEERVYVGEVPDSVRRVQGSPTKIITSVEVRKDPKSQIKDKWFNFDMPFNSGLVAIIGNKGSGKSALADIIGLLGNTKRFMKFSFLTNDKFCSKRGGRADHFQGKIIWRDLKERTIETLNASHDVDLREKVKYIPQSYLEDICSEVGLDDNGPFYSELKDVIFSRIDEADRLGFDNLDSLLKHRDKEIEYSIDQLIGDVKALNRDIVEIELKLSGKHKRELHASLNERKNELAAHESDDVKPKLVTKPEEDEVATALSEKVSAKLFGKKKDLEEIETKIKIEKKKDFELAKKISSSEKVIKLIDNVKRFISTSMADIKEDIDILELQDNDVVAVTYGNIKVEEKLAALILEREAIRGSILNQDEGSLNKRKENIESEISGFTSELSAPQKKYQDYLSDLVKWEERKEVIIGDEKSIGSIKYLETQLKKIQDDYPNERRALARQRFRKALEIYREKHLLRAHYSKYYGAVQEFLDHHPIAQKQNFQINFDVSVAERDFGTKFLQLVNQARSGNFYGADVGLERVSTLVNRTNFDSICSVRRFLGKILDDLEIYNGKPNEIEDQIKKGVTKEGLFDLVFSLEYLNPVYNLKWDDKELDQLSPGERGNLLLIFYLILDQNDIPLIIDQPEENLDNQTVYKTLVPCVKDAKKRRQIILVTHNPNLAVVCDAEQIIHAVMHKNSENEVVYTSGSIENLDMNVKIVDVLEGTRPAFDKRDSKYWD